MCQMSGFARQNTLDYLALDDTLDETLEIDDSGQKAVPPAGLEPATCGLEVRRSIQLSYEG
jgi:hypothetical protein